MPSDDQPGRSFPTPPEDSTRPGRGARDDLERGVEAERGDLTESPGPSATGQQGFPEEATGSFAEKLTVDPTRGDTKG